MVLCTEWDRGNADGTQFCNNIFYVAGQVTYDWGKSQNTIFSNNVFFGLEGKYLWLSTSTFGTDTRLDGAVLTANIGYRF